MHGGLPVRAQRCAHGGRHVRVTFAAETQILLPLPIAMSRRLFQRRQFDQSLCEQLIDEAFARYLDWLAESEAVTAAYGVWSRVTGSNRALPFAAYRAALDREEQAATVYRSVIDRVAQLSVDEHRLARAWPAAAHA